MDESTLTKVKELKVGLWIGIIILIVGILASIDSEIIDHVGVGTPQDCFPNQKLIVDAIKSYNSNTLKWIETALPGKDFEELEELLIKNWYLNNPIKLPTPECSYGYITVDKKEIVFCKLHGSPDSIIIPDYDRSKERPFSDKYLKKIEELKSASMEKASTIAQIRNSIDPTIIIIFGLLIVILIAEQIYTIKKIQLIFLIYIIKNILKLQ